MSSQQIAGTVALKDNLTDVSQIFSNIVNQVTANLAPAINAVVDSFKEFVSSAGGARHWEKSISDGIFDALEAAAGVVDQIALKFAQVGETCLGLTGSVWENVSFHVRHCFQVCVQSCFIISICVLYVRSYWLRGSCLQVCLML